MKARASEHYKYLKRYNVNIKCPKPAAAKDFLCEYYALLMPHRPLPTFSVRMGAHLWEHSCTINVDDEIFDEQSRGRKSMTFEGASTSQDTNEAEQALEWLQAAVEKQIDKQETFHFMPFVIIMMMLCLLLVIKYV